MFFTIFPLLALAEDAALNNQQVPTTGKRSQMGEINIVEQGPKKDPYLVVQDAAIVFFAKLEQDIKSLRTGGSASVGVVSDQILNFLTGVYLYCIVNSGSCPYILDAILETDIINARLGKNNACPNMMKFWTQWVRNNMDTRHKYLMKTAHFNVTNDFNKNQRPAFILCEDTVKKAISDSAPNTDYFKRRYTDGSEPERAPTKLRLLLEKLKEEGIDVFKKTGAIR